MNNAITEFFAAATSNRFAAEGAIMGVIAYALGFFFVPDEFFDGDFASIVESAAVDAGVSTDEMTAWIEDNADKIEAAIRIVGDENDRPRPPVPGDTTWLLENGITREEYSAAWERRLMS